MACTSGETRPSKLRLPESTAAAIRPLSLMVLEIGAGSGPELPMQVVQPKPTRLKPIWSSSFCRPDFSRYSATTWMPGASEVLTQGFCLRPRRLALRASRPAPISTRRVGRVGAGGDGGDHDVAMAEIEVRAFDGIAACRASTVFLYSVSIALAKPAAMSSSATRPSGRFGPAIDGTTVAEVEFEQVGEDRIGGVARRATCPAPWNRPRPARCGSRRGPTW